MSSRPDHLAAGLRSGLVGTVAIRTPSRLIHWSLFSGFLVLCILLLLIFGQFTRRQSATGQLDTAAAIASIKARESSQVAELLVAEGQSVRRGELLARLERGSRLPDLSDADSTRVYQAERALKLLQTRRANVEALAQIDLKRLQERRESLLQSLAQTRDMQAMQQRQAELDQADAKSIQTLQQRGLVSRSQAADAKRTELASTLKSQTTHADLTRLEAEQRQLLLDIERLPAATAAELALIDQQIEEQKQKTLEAHERQGQVLVAPIDGVVSGLQVKTGTTVAAGSLLMDIVPTDAQYHAVLYLPSRAIGFVHEGQTVGIRYQAFPYQRFGIQSGRIASVSKAIFAPDEITASMNVGNEPVYRVTVALTEQHVRLADQHYPLQEGMLLDADIELDRRAVWQLLFDPILALKDRA